MEYGQQTTLSKGLQSRNSENEQSGLSHIGATDRCFYNRKFFRRKRGLQPEHFLDGVIPLWLVGDVENGVYCTGRKGFETSGVMSDF